MGVQIFLNFDNPSATFHPGEVITGNVSLSTTSPIVVKGLTVAFHGEGNVFWTETITVRRPNSQLDHNRPTSHHPHHHSSPHHQHTDHHHHNSYHHHHTHHNHHNSHQHHHIENNAPITRIKEFKNQETYLNNIIGIPLYERESGSTVELPAGFSRQIPFAFQLPMNLPTSCELDSGSIKYFAEASITIKTSILVLTFDTTKSSKKSFQMRGSLNLTQVHGALLPIELQKQKQFGFLCCGSSGEFLMQLRLARTGFAAGENIMFRINYSNSTDVTFEKLKVKLVQNILYITFGKKMKEAQEIGEIQQSVEITQGISGEWQDQLLVPHAALLTNFGGCRIMQIKYVLVISGHASWNRCAKIEVPITVGTLPGNDVNGLHYGQH